MRGTSPRRNETNDERTNMKNDNQNIQQPEVEILRRAVLFSLTTHSWRNRKQADPSKVTADCATGALNSTKRLLESDALNAIMAHLNATYNWCLARAMYSGVRRGVYFVKRDMVGEFESYIAQAGAELRDVLVPAFLAEYEACIAGAAKPAADGGLGELFDRKDYPSPDDLAACFGFDHSWLALSVPDELPEEVNRRECAKLRASFEEAQVEVKFALREGFKALVDKARSLLVEKKSDGRQRAFRQKSLEAMDKFFATFEARNMMADGELTALVCEAKSALRGIDVKKLARDSVFRGEVAERFNVVNVELEKLLVDRPRRAFLRDEN